MLDLIYYSLHALGFLACALYILRFAGAYELDGKKSVLIFLCFYSCSYLLMLLLYFLIVGKFGGQNVVRIFVFIPVFSSLFCRIFRTDVIRSLDLFAPLVCICQAFGKIGCQIVGCCQSQIAVSWGIPNRYTGTRLFPVQLLEGAVSAAIAVGLVLFAKKRDFRCRGLCMPYMFISFGVTRFFLEFLRNNVKLFWGISELALWCVFMTVVGVCWLFVDRWNRWDPRTES